VCADITDEEDPDCRLEVSILGGQAKLVPIALRQFLTLHVFINLSGGSS
jgi:hypothetical protein